MELSIVIVNYNVQHFLHQCLNSVKKAIEDIQAEVFVVDNNSVDGSVEMVAQEFPWVTLIANKDNVGFSKANNQAMWVAKGKYVLLLNPDTVVQEDTFTKCLAYASENPKLGGLGIKMVDGKGTFLPESKRGLPTPWVAFYKIFGLSKLFPNSKRFGQYHLSFLSKDENHVIQVLSGAFMMMKKEALDKVGLLDEDYFMYGEDIDLSYRITKGGYENHYFSDSQIIHYKGESTKKGSLNYVFVFYRAMIIFAKKHFSGNQANVLNALINLAIYFRAGLSLLNRLVKQLWLPVLDVCIIALVFWSSAQGYQHLLDKHLKPEILRWSIPTLAIIWYCVQWFNGVYYKPFKWEKLIKSGVVSSVSTLVFYSLLDEEFRFSRMVILIGSTLGLLYLLLSRALFKAFRISHYASTSIDAKKIVVVGETEAIEQVKSGILHLLKNKENILPFLTSDNHLSIQNLLEFVRINKADEVIFCSESVNNNQIISAMTQLAPLSIEFKIAPPNFMYVIGSNSIDTNGELYLIDTNSINTHLNKRNKRLFDLAASIIQLCLFPILIFVVKKPVSWLKNLRMVFFGEKTWIGISQELSTHLELKTPPSVIIIDNGFTGNTSQNPGLIYAKNYKVQTDIELIIKNLKHLGSA